MRNTSLVIAAALFLVTYSVPAQEVPSPDTLTAEVRKVKNDLAVLKKLKLSGYIQVQYQHADLPGLKTFAGGDFQADSKNRFIVRRGRIRMVYEGDVTQVTFQIDATEKGVGIRDVFFKLTEPKKKWVSLTAGLFIRPFNYELIYSSTLRESPERARMNQILFPGERDVGAMVTVHPPAENKLHLLKLEAGFVNGAGLNLDFDNRLDAFGRVSAAEWDEAKRFNYRAGVSFYSGGVRQSTDTLYRMNGECFEAQIDTSGEDRYSKRNYFGADAEISYNSKLGATIVRGEFTQGIQSGTKALNTSFGRAPDKSIYERKFRGAVVYLIQGFFKDRHQLVFKYDFFDPNTDVTGHDMQLHCGLTSTELLYHTFGFGYIWIANKHLKFMAYFDLVKNEEASDIGITDDMDDNVVTVRAQVKF
ncbi:MAG TPA: hypothetical protein VNJ07_01940 [Chitinophagales bacterium]|nr:hypothetical protein [Chitinophagales bacterium]